MNNIAPYALGKTNMKSVSWTVHGFTITSWGNGLAYTVEKDGVDFYLQGEDASQWRDEYDAADERDRLAIFLSDSMGDYAAPR